MTAPPVITVINGPNLAGLGTRQPEHYGRSTQKELMDTLREKATSQGLTLDFFQSDVEGELVRKIGEVSGRSIGLVINPAAYSHYSIAVLDAMIAFEGPVVEVHLSRIFSRESYRRELITAEGADVLIAGAGPEGYLHAMELICYLKDSQQD